MECLPRSIPLVSRCGDDLLPIDPKAVATYLLDKDQKLSDGVMCMVNALSYLTSVQEVSGLNDSLRRISHQPKGTRWTTCARCWNTWTGVVLPALSLRSPPPVVPMGDLVAEKITEACQR